MEGFSEGCSVKAFLVIVGGTVGAEVDVGAKVGLLLGILDGFSLCVWVGIIKDLIGALVGALVEVFVLGVFVFLLSWLFCSKLLLILFQSALAKLLGKEMKGHGIAI